MNLVVDYCIVFEHLQTEGSRERRRAFVRGSPGASSFLLKEKALHEHF